MEFMGVEEVTVNEQDPHAVGFTGIWDLKFISGAIATRRAAPIRCCICVCPLTARKQITKGRAPLNAGHGLSVLSFIESGDQG